MSESPPLESKIDKMQGLIDKVLKIADDRFKYYEKLIPKYRISSIALRAFSVIGILASTVLTLLSERTTEFQTWFGGSAETAIALAAISALILTFDKFFIISNNWKYFTIAKMEIAQAKDVAEIEWNFIKIQAESNGFTPEQQQLGANTCNNLLSAVHKAQAAETQKWSENLGKAINSLKEELSTFTMKAEDELAAKQQRAKQTAPCILKLIVKNPQLIKEKLSIEVGSTSFVKEPSAILTLENIPTNIGPLPITFSYINQNNKRDVLEDAFIPKAGEIVEVLFELSSPNE